MSKTEAPGSKSVSLPTESDVKPLDFDAPINHDLEFWLTVKDTDIKYKLTGKEASISKVLRNALQRKDCFEADNKEKVLPLDFTGTEKNTKDIKSVLPFVILYMRHCQGNEGPTIKKGLKKLDFLSCIDGNEWNTRLMTLSEESDHWKTYVPLTKKDDAKKQKAGGGDAGDDEDVDMSTKTKTVAAKDDDKKVTTTSSVISATSRLMKVFNQDMLYTSCFNEKNADGTFKYPDLAGFKVSTTEMAVRYDLILMANYLDIENFLLLTACAYAFRIKGNLDDDVRSIMIQTVLTDKQTNEAVAAKRVSKAAEVQEDIKKARANAEKKALEGQNAMKTSTSSSSASSLAPQTSSSTTSTTSSSSSSKNNVIDVST